MEEKQFKNLSEILLDPEADVAEKDEAAWLLSEYSDEKALVPLTQASLHPSENDLLLLVEYGEAIGSLWLKKDYFDLETYLNFPGKTRAGIYLSFEAIKPDIVEKFKLNEYGFN